MKHTYHWSFIAIFVLILSTSFSAKCFELPDSVETIADHQTLKELLPVEVDYTGTVIVDTTYTKENRITSYGPRYNTFLFEPIPDGGKTWHIFEGVKTIWDYERGISYDIKVHHAVITLPRFHRKNINGTIIVKDFILPKNGLDVKYWIIEYEEKDYIIRYIPNCYRKYMSIELKVNKFITPEKSQG